MKFSLYGTVFAVILTLSLFSCGKEAEKNSSMLTPETEQEISALHEKYSVASFAGGCFWCMEPPFERTEGVVYTHVGYLGGEEENPTYEQVSSGRTGHAEAIEVFYDPKKVTYRDLLQVFWTNIDPTDPTGQFADKGRHYRTAIFHHNEEQRKIAEQSKKELSESGKFSKPVVTQIVPAGKFWRAEEYHQNYYEKNPIHYGMYKKGSGREGYLKKTWGN